MTPAFWDTSALVPLCVLQPVSPVVRLLVRQHALVVWWATPIEMQSAFERLARMGDLAAAERSAAELDMDWLRKGWREIQPSETLRIQAMAFLRLYSLRVADAMQLAAASVWAGGSFGDFVFVAGDEQLLAAARQVGFQVMAV